MSTATQPAEGTSPATSAPEAPASAPVATPAPNPSKPAPSVTEAIRQLTPQQRRDIIGRRVKPATAPAAVAPAPPKPAEAAPAAPATEPAAPAAEPAAATPPEPAPAEPPATPEGEEPEPAASADPEGQDPSEQPEARTPDRFRFKNPEDQAIALIAKARGVGLAEAARIYRGEPAPTASADRTPATEPAAPAEPTVDPGVAQYDQRIETTRTKVQELAAKRKQHREDAEFDKADEVGDELANVRADLKFLEHEKQGYLRSREAEQAATYQRTAEAAAARVYQQFPAFAKEDSMERLALDAYVIRQRNDPGRKAIFADPNWPEALAKEFAEKNGIKPGAAKPVAQAPAAPAAPATPAPSATLPKSQPRQVAATPGAKLLTSADGTPPSTPGATTREQIESRIRTDPDFRRGLVRSLSQAGRK